MPLVKTQTETLQFIIERLSHYTKLPQSNFSASELFSNYKIDSIVAVTIVSDLEEFLGVHLDATLLWEFDNLNDTINWIFENKN